MDLTSMLLRYVKPESDVRSTKSNAEQQQPDLGLQ